MTAYAYVGPLDIAEAAGALEAVEAAAAGSVPRAGATSRPGQGDRIRTPADLDAFLSSRPQDELHEPHTFVVDLSGTLRLAPRRSEHVACAGGEAVRAAGELAFARTAQGWTVTYASNQSTGYCPDVESWPAVAAALARAGITHGSAYTHPITYRRCPECGEWNSVQDAHFVCVFCDADLPASHRTGPMDLALLADEEGNAVRITVLGRHPQVPGRLEAEIVVATPFVQGRLALALSRSRLETWGRALNSLESGEDIAWMAVERGPSVFIHLTGERDCPEVVVEDQMISMVTVRVPISLPEDWIASHRQRLSDVLAAHSPH
ncbi:DUF5959 family protein [Streptomyces montanus]|uniref:DUF5959 family protein n=1 Tax=Streptomyces montanus TaxID=2580423 RepID=UPI001BB1F638|nr:DUF5959 family protein [Streptomyces montanus]